MNKNMNGQVTEEWVVNHCRDFGRYPVIIDTTPLADFSIPNHPEFFLQEPHNNFVIIEITSFRGISIGAIHYYANIYCKMPVICSKEEDGRVYRHGGLICNEWEEMPKEITSFIGGRYHIEANRPVTKEELEKYPDRWEGYELGDNTPSFETMSEAISVAKRIAEYRFPGKKIKIDIFE